MKELDYKNDELLREMLRSSDEMKAPQGFEERIMSNLRAEAINERFSMLEFIREFFPYIASTVVLIIVLIANWQRIPWFSGIQSESIEDAGKTIVFLQSFIDSFTGILHFFGTSSIAVVFILAILVYAFADRIFGHLYQSRRSGSIPLVL